MRYPNLTRKLFGQGFPHQATNRVNFFHATIPRQSSLGELERVKIRIGIGLHIGNGTYLAMTNVDMVVFGHMPARLH